MYEYVHSIWYIFIFFRWYVLCMYVAMIRSIIELLSRYDADRTPRLEFFYFKKWSEKQEKKNADDLFLFFNFFVVEKFRQLSLE